MKCCEPQNIDRNIEKGSSICPSCGAAGQGVDIRTLKHWLLTHFVPKIPAIPFYFCKTKNCPIVYFSADHSKQYTKDELRYRIGIKETQTPIPVCYCFGVTEDMILKEIQGTGKSSFSAWIAKEVKYGNCACDVRNPSGWCCLGDITKVEREGEKFRI